MPTPALPFIAWDNRFADAVPIASSTQSGSVANLSDFRSYTSWTPAALPATAIVDCGSVKSADNLAVCSHTLFSTGCSIEVRGSTDNFVASDVLLASHTPTSDNPFIVNFASASYRYWRIRITGAASMPTIAIAAIGVGLQFPNGLPLGQFDPLHRTAVAQTNVSEHGLPLGKSILFEQYSQLLQFQVIDQSWIRSTFIPAWKAALVKNPFLFAYDLANHPGEIYLVQSDDATPMSAVPDTPVYATLTFGIKGVALA